MTYNFKGLDKCEGDEGTLEIDEFTEDGDKNFRIKTKEKATSKLTSLIFLSKLISSYSISNKKAGTNKYSN